MRTTSLILLFALVGCGRSDGPEAQAGPPAIVIRAPCVGFAACEAACTAGGGPACFELGTLQIAAEMMRREEAGEGGEASAQAVYDAAQAEAPRATFARAAQLLDAACNAAEVTACYYLGRQNAEGWGVAPDQARSLRLLIQACEGGVADACTGVGWQYFEGLAVAKDQAQGLKYLERGCAGHHPPACQSAGHAYLQGQGVEPDEERGRSLMQQACSAGLREACASAGGARE